MSKKPQNMYVCSNCDAQFLKWSGRCLECGAWGTLQTQVVDNKSDSTILTEAAKLVNLGEIKNQNLDRIKTGIGEVDRVFGGGIVAGSLILLAGEPGIGKSTIVAQIANSVQTAKDEKIIYVSAEESASQVKSRFDRLNCDLQKIEFIGDTNTEKIISAIKKKDKLPPVVIIDSIQTIYSSESQSETGSVNQIRANTAKFLELAKNNDIAVILIGHVTKDGSVAGPKTLEHMVDTVIYFESENSHDYRMLRAVKNRFGSINELGIFEMTGSGFNEITNPSAIFLNNNKSSVSGSVACCIMEGTRPFLIEIQALVSKTVFGYPQRKASGFDLNRTQILTSVLSKKTKVNLINQDVILNIVGGFKINDPALDLAVCFAISSSFFNKAIAQDTIVLGEVGLGGEIRNVSKLEQRLAEAEKIGFAEAIVPDCDVKAGKIKLRKVKNLGETINF